MIGIIDYGAGNTRSVTNALDRLDADWTLSDDPNALDQTDRLILPGVGAAGSAMRALNERGLADWIRATKMPLLGVCLGLQLLYERSEEDNTECLGLITGTVQRFPERREPVPHIGWNTLQLIDESALIDASMEGDYAYFVHSFAAPVSPKTIATCTYSGMTFSAAIQQKHLVATQFHPEKSAALGASILRNFLTL